LKELRAPKKTTHPTTIHCRGNVWNEPMPGNDEEIDRKSHMLMGEIYEGRRWYGVRCHDIIKSGSGIQRLIAGYRSMQKHTQTRTERRYCKLQVNSFLKTFKVASSPLLSKNVKIRVYWTIILPMVLYGCETWSLALKEKLDWGYLRTACWGKYLDQGQMKWQGDGECNIVTSFMICPLRQVQFAWYSQEEWHRRGM
jgi:hypothetical protein